MGATSIWLIIVSNLRGAMLPGDQMKSGISYLRTSRSRLPATEAQWSATMTKTVSLNHGLVCAAVRKAPMA